MGVFSFLNVCFGDALWVNCGEEIELCLVSCRIDEVHEVGSGHGGLGSLGKETIGEFHHQCLVVQSQEGKCCLTIFSFERKTSEHFLEEVVDYLGHYHHPIVVDFAKGGR